MPAQSQYVARDSDIAPVAALIADPTRAAILTTLLDGRPLTAGELARLAGVSAATASAHLARLLGGGLVTMTRQGRHHYYHLAGPGVAAAVLEAMAHISPRPAIRSLRQSRQATALAEARTCYDHLAGRAGVALLAALLENKIITSKVLNGRAPAGQPWPADSPFTAEYEVTKHGSVTLAAFGINCEDARRSRRRFAGACLDWTERRPHLGGALGAVVLARLLDLGWFERRPVRRALSLTQAGREGLAGTFGCAILG